MIDKYEAVRLAASDSNGEMVERRSGERRASAATTSDPHANLVGAVRKLVKAKGRFHTEQNYAALVTALDEYDRAQQKGTHETTDQA